MRSEVRKEKVTSKANLRHLYSYPFPRFSEGELSCLSEFVVRNPRLTSPFSTLGLHAKFSGEATTEKEDFHSWICRSSTRRTTESQIFHHWIPNGPWRRIICQSSPQLGSFSTLLRHAPAQHQTFPVKVCIHPESEEYVSRYKQLKQAGSSEHLHWSFQFDGFNLCVANASKNRLNLTTLEPFIAAWSSSVSFCLHQCV